MAKKHRYLFVETSPFECLFTIGTYWVGGGATRRASNPGSWSRAAFDVNRDPRLVLFFLAWSRRVIPLATWSMMRRKAEEVQW